MTIEDAWKREACKVYWKRVIAALKKQNVICLKMKNMQIRAEKREEVFHHMDMI